MSARLPCLCALGIVLLGPSTSILAQAPTNLVVRREIPVGRERATGFMLPIVTDADGNLYVRYSDGQQRLDTINEISPAGKKLLSFSLVNVPGLAEAEIGSFSVSDAKLVVLARKGIGSAEVMHVVVFGLDGALLSSARIEADVQASQIEALTSNRFVITGRARDAGSPDSTPKTAILNNSGQLLGSVPLDGDVAPLEKGKRTTANGVLRQDREFETSVVASTITTGDDGNVYLMRYGRSSLVFVISPSGAVLHRFRLESPSNSSLKEVKVNKHRIAALFVRGKPGAESETDATFIRTYEADSGKLLASYLLDPRIPDLMAAYDGDAGFTFFGPEVVDPHDLAADQPGRLQIFQVGPR
jgi:predicted regulator of Ras-like GTPase activity (Roadblock/LC7/MglB family)